MVAQTIFIIGSKKNPSNVCGFYHQIKKVSTDFTIIPFCKNYSGSKEILFVNLLKIFLLFKSQHTYI